MGHNQDKHWVSGEKGLVFTTKNGTSLLEPTARNNKCAKIPNAWYRLLNRVCKFQPRL